MKHGQFLEKQKNKTKQKKKPPLKYMQYPLELLFPDLFCMGEFHYPNEEVKAWQVTQ